MIIITKPYTSNTLIPPVVNKKKNTKQQSIHFVNLIGIISVVDIITIRLQTKNTKTDGVTIILIKNQIVVIAHVTYDSII